MRKTKSVVFLFAILSTFMLSEATLFARGGGGGGGGGGRGGGDRGGDDYNQRGYDNRNNTHNDYNHNNYRNEYDNGSYGGSYYNYEMSQDYNAFPEYSDDANAPYNYYSQYELENNTNTPPD